MNQHNDTSFHNRPTGHEPAFVSAVGASQPNRIASQGGTMTDQLLISSGHFDRLVSETDRIRVRKNIEEKLRAAGRKFFPTDEQWKMILTPSRNAYVVAGAGSGKSTTLTLRLYVLIHVLRIPQEEISVFSFTRTSCADLRKKVRKDFSMLGVKSNLSDQALKHLVTTFHAKVMALTRDRFVGKRLFDETNCDANSKNEQHDSLPFPKKSKELSQTQMRWLRQAYEDACRNSPDFRRTLERLEDMSNPTASPRAADDKQLKMYADIARKINDRDEVVHNAVHNFVLEQSEKHRRQTLLDLMPFLNNVGRSGISTRVDAGTDSTSTTKYNFRPTFVIPTKQGQRHVFLDISEFGWGTDVVPSGTVNFATANAVRLKILAKFGDSNIEIVGQRDLSSLLSRIVPTGLESPQANSNNGPDVFQTMSLKLFGMRTPAPAYASFFDEASFAEGLGIDVVEMAERDGKNARIEGASPKEMYFFCLGVFWRAFKVVLKREGFFRFSDAFAAYSTCRSDGFKGKSVLALSSLKHVLVDEFQDISPESANWLRSTLKVLHNVHRASTSLMCVGDDWQSIYGWRGAAPENIVRFKEKFQSSPRAEELRMVINFRSLPNIVAAAEKVIDKTADCVIAKQTRAVETKDRWKGQLTLVDYGSDHPDMDAVAAFIRQAIASKQATWAGDQPPQWRVLSRSNSLLKKMRERLPSQGLANVQFYTFHGAKGLEADYCVLLGDCFGDDQHELRDHIYRVAGMGGSSDRPYENAMAQEAQRLAYVALTRAAKELWWFCGELDRNRADKSMFKVLAQSNAEGLIVLDSARFHASLGQVEADR